MIETVGRNPQVKKEVDIYGWAGFAAIEAIALYALVVALVILTGK
jgi:F-type H+-transporting ATPase subunit c